MPKYELTVEQAKTLNAMIDNMSFKGSDAPAVLELKDALAMPAPDEPENAQ